MPDVLPLRPADPQRLGRYRLLGRLGSGGQGVVYLGRSRSGEPVAIKLLHDHFVGDARARRYFARELEAVQRVDPFCTAKVLAADVEGDIPYIVSELIDGPSLHRVVQDDGPRSGRALDRLAIGTATALAAIHQAGVVHRDFKPGNVLIGPSGPRVIDFGVARAMDSTGPMTSQVVGTPAYMAPEQLGGDRPGAAADVFAWGCTMVYAANGRPPFGDDFIPAVINRILHEEPDLGEMNGHLRELVVDCLDKKTDLRPSAQHLLLQLLGNEENVAAQLDDAAMPTAMLAKGTALAGPDTPPVALTAVATAAVTKPIRPRRRFTLRRLTRRRLTGSPWRRRLVLLGLLAAMIALPTGVIVWRTTSEPPYDGGSTSSTESGSATRPQRGRLPGTSATLVQDLTDQPVTVSSYQVREATSGVPAGTVYLADPDTGKFQKTSYEVAVTSQDGWWTAVRLDAKKRLLMVLDRSSNQSHNIEVPNDFTNPQWSPGGQQLLLTAKRGEVTTGFIVIDTNNWEPAVVKVSDQGVGTFWWNVDGSEVLTNVGKANTVRFYESDGKRLRDVPGAGGPLKGAASGVVSPSGHRLTTECAGGGAQLCVRDPNTGKVENRLPLPAGATLAGWYDNNHLVLARSRDYVVVDLKGKVTATLAKADSAAGMPTLSFTFNGSS